MTDYLKRFGMILGFMAGLFAVIGGVGWLIAQAFIAGGFFGGMGAILVLACALAAASPDGGCGPR